MNARNKIVQVFRWLLLIVVSLHPVLQAQDFSNKGRDFWIPYPEHVNGTSSAMGIYITSDATATVTIKVGAVTLPSFTVQANTVIRKFIGPNANGDAPNTGVHMTGIQDGIGAGRGIQVTSDRPVVVFAHIIFQNRSGATLVLPKTVWGKEYIVPSFGNNGTTASYGEINIIASQPNTQVKITPSRTLRNGARTVGVPYFITIPNVGDVYQVQAQRNEDLSGTHIESVATGTSGCEPIAVFSATTWSAFPCAGASGGDNLFQQLFPVAAWGKQFITAPLKKSTTNAADNNVDIIRVYVQNPATVVNKTENGVTTPLTGLVTPGNYFQYTASNPSLIQSDNPVQAVQFITSQTCGNPQSISDPEMIILSPVEQTINDINVFSAHQNYVPTGQSSVTTHYINVVMKTANTGTFRINGNAPTSPFTPITGTQFSYLKENLTLQAATNPIFKLQADSGFNAIAYGFGNVESYGYNAGTYVKDPYQKIQVETPGAAVKVLTTCRNTPFVFTMTFPYKPTKLQWVFGGNLNAQNIPDTTINSPVPFDSTLINGRKVYSYKINRSYKIQNVALYAINLIATNPTSDGCGGEQEIAFDLDVLENPVAKLNYSNVCLGQPVTFTDASIGYGRSLMKFISDFGDNTTSNILNPTKTYTDTGNFAVKYVVTTDVGCISDTMYSTIRIRPTPTATMTLSGNATECANSTQQPRILFKGSLGEKPYTFNYSINGTPASPITTVTDDTVSIPVPVNTAGTFTYSLQSVKEGSSNGCSQNQTGSVAVTIRPLPTATISGTSTVCRNDPQPRILFKGGHASTPYTFIYNIDGGPNLSITTTVGDTISIAAPTSSDQTYTYNLVSVTDGGGANACTQTATGSATVTIRPLPTASISGSTSLCMNEAAPYIIFTGIGTTPSYTFEYAINGGATQTISTSNTSSTVSLPVSTNVAGSFTYTLLKVTDGTPNACKQTITGTAATVTVWPLPTAAYTTNSPVCASGTIDFTDQSLANSSKLDSWLWNFGDPTSGVSNTSDIQNPRHVFEKHGSYNISLTVTNSNGCKSINTLPAFIVHPKPKAGYVIPEVCLDDTYAQFLDTSKVDAPGVVTQWNWNFGDPIWNDPPFSSPNTAVVKDPQHRYKKVGDYDVSLMIVTNNGCRDTIVQRLVVNGSFPVAKFEVQNPSKLCANDSIAIVDQSTVFPGVITKVMIYWDDIGNPSVVETDENTQLGKVYKHLYPNFQSPLTKTYRIRFLAYSGGTCLKETSKTITVHAAPKTQFTTLNNICYDALPLQITQASETGGVPGSFVFTGPGISPAGLFSPSIAGEGTHTLKYKYTSTAAGCSDSVNQTIKVWKRAMADFEATTSPLCEKQPVTLTDKSSSQEGAISQWRWDYKDGSPLETRTAATAFPHIFPVYASYPVTLTVVTSNGCVSAPKTVNLAVQPLARPNFAFPPVSCLPDAVIPFTNSSSVPDASASTLSYLWNFGDPSSGPVNTSTAKDPAHTYATLGPFNVKLQVKTEAGCFHDTTIILNTIHPQPIASFTVSATDVCLGGALQFNNTSNTQDGTLKTLQWDLGDLTTRNIPSFSHTYANTGLKTVTLRITNSFDCISTIAQQTVSVNPNPIADAGPNRIVLEGAQITIEATATNANGLTYLWTPSKGLNNPTLLKPTASPDSATRYLLTVTSDKGCTDTSSMFLKVLYKPIPVNTFTPNGDGINDVWDIQYIDAYPGAIIEVYSTDAQLVFRSFGYNKPWDGTRNGLPLPVGTYYYVIDPKNGRAKMAGYVTILR